MGEGGSLLGEEVVGHMVSEHLADQLGEVYRSAPPFLKSASKTDLNMYKVGRGT